MHNAHSCVCSQSAKHIYTARQALQRTARIATNRTASFHFSSLLSYFCFMNGFLVLSLTLYIFHKNMYYIFINCGELHISHTKCVCARVRSYTNSLPMYRWETLCTRLLRAYGWFALSLALPSSTVQFVWCVSIKFGIHSQFAGVCVCATTIGCAVEPLSSSHIPSSSSSQQPAAWSVVWYTYRTTLLKIERHIY